MSGQYGAGVRIAASLLLTQASPAWRGFLPQYPANILNAQGGSGVVGCAALEVECKLI